MKRLRVLSKITAVFVLAAMIVASAGSMGIKAEGGYYLSSQISGSYDLQIEPGETRHFVIPVKTGNTSMSLDTLRGGQSSDFVVSNIKLINPKINTTSSNGVSTLNAKTVYNLEFDLTASDSLKIGYNKIEILVTGRKVGPSTGEDVNIEYLDNAPLISLVTYTYSELKPAEIVVDRADYDDKDIYPGNSLTLKLKVKNTGEKKALNVYLNMDFGETGLVPDYKEESLRVGNISAGVTTTVEVPVKVLSSAKSGAGMITANFTCKDESGNSEGPFKSNIYITVNGLNEEEAKKNHPFITISTDENYKVLTPDTTDMLNIVLKNNGEVDAKNVKVIIKSGLDTSIGLTKGFTSDAFPVGDIKAGKEVSVGIPVNVAKSFGTGIYELQMEASYTDTKDNELVSSPMTMYVKGSSQENDSHTIVSIGNVSQYPEYPKAGEKVTVSFDVVNEGNTDITDVRLSGTGLSSASFEPVSSEPYKKLGTIKAGESQRVSMTFRVGKDAPDGFGTLNINCEFYNGGKESLSETAGLYVLNIKNYLKETPAEKKISRPKLIINHYETEPIIDLETIGENDDIEKLSKELRAGGIFDFKYSIKNTHATKAAKNIKITMEQAEGIFAPTEGSNIFYIDEIPAGETAEQIIRLRTRSDVATGDYAISIKVEYEYDDMSEVDTERGGVTDENTIKLHAIENYRPEIENIFIDSYEPISVGMPVDLSFEFYNMGKSTLGNVYITIEGDFELANNATKSYVGAVSGYGQEYCNPQIVPLVGGEAHGTVVVHFEDSNGDEQIKTAEFSAYVEDGGFDPGFEGEYGEYDPGFEGEFGEYDPGFMGEDEPQETEILGLPLWLFITICSGVAVIIIVIIIVIVVKKKHRKALLEEDDE